MLVWKSSAAMLAAMLFMLTTLVNCDKGGNNGNDIVLPTTPAALFADFNNHNSIALELLARQPEYNSPPSIQKIAAGTYMAVNFAMGNSLWVVTPENTIIVFDVPESNEVTVLIRDAMRQQPEIGNKPITFLFYSIYHGDHAFGAQPLVEDPHNNGVPPVIVAHKNMVEQAELFDTFSFIKFNRILRVFGSLLPDNIAIYPFTPLKLGSVQWMEYYPSVLLQLNKQGDTQDLILNGLSFTAIYVAGYAEDQLTFWFPATKVIHAADVFFGLLPNVYTIRAEPARDAIAFVKAARIIQSYNAEVLYPSHRHALFGRDNIYRQVGKNADIIQYIHDQTVRLLGKGHTPEVAARMIKLPQWYTSEPLMGEFYETVEGNSKAVADHYTGWFNGQAEDLLPVSKTDLARNMVHEFGRERLLQAARKAYQSGDYRWSLSLATHVWLYDNKSMNDALYWRTQSMKRLAENLSAVQWRNFLLTEAMIEWKMLPAPYQQAALFHSRPSHMVVHTLNNCFTLLSVHLNSSMTDGVDKTIDLRVTDDPNLQPGQIYRLRINNDVLTFNTVAAVDPLNPTSFPLFQTTNVPFREVLAGFLTIDQALDMSAVSVIRGSRDDIKSFLGYFDFVDQL